MWTVHPPRSLRSLISRSLRGLFYPRPPRCRQGSRAWVGFASFARPSTSSLAASCPSAPKGRPILNTYKRWSSFFAFIDKMIIRDILQEKSAVREHPRTADILTFAKTVFRYQIIYVSTFVRLQLQPWKVLNINSEAENFLCHLPTFTTALPFLFLYFIHSQSIYNS